ncbi:endonuclease/exonuclease/phosphatase family protein [Streptomyces sp. WAC00276]|uniref:endonuclease/exonuclease/phosphatase family protein n=1 Tax=Streptomyces sp. WAC00276 TaxID=2933778 RepID=UPI001FFE36E4|nr:endonuclease/exonuclease/phosphatase family protein [Streptomyces sp. WAC00276]MCK2140221.1 endonuclease/exonuclease/phosphatase family protein [Streptomyces sp. WAC00276]
MTAYDGSATAEGGAGPPKDGERVRRRRPGRFGAAVSLLLAAVLLFPELVPNARFRAGSLVETFLPWLGVLAVLLLLVGLARRSPLAVGAALVPVAAWLLLFAPLVAGGVSGDGARLSVVQHNVSDENPDPVGTAQALAAPGPDLIAVEELTEKAAPSYRRALREAYSHHVAYGTVALWSRYPLLADEPVDLRPAGVDESWRRGLRTTVRTPHGDVAVYVVHLPSLRITSQGMRTQRRDESARLLGARLERERAGRVLVVGDLNGTLDDRGLAPVTGRTGRPQGGFAFSWPERFPLARIDHVLGRSVSVVGVRTLPATGSDHLPLLARVDLRGG